MSGRIEQDQKREIWIKNHVNSCCDLIQKYMISKEGVHTSSTRKANLGYLIQYEKIMKEMNIDLLKVLPMDIDVYRKKISEGNKEGIVNAKISAVYSFYEFLIENDLINKNPCRNKRYKVKDNDNSIVYMTSKEERKLKENIINNRSRRTNKWKKRDFCIVTIGLSTGLRISEITNIDVEDIDFENKKIINVYVKGGRTREIFIGDNTIKAIKDWMEEREKYIKDPTQKALFISQKGNRISNRVVEHMISEETKNFDKHITPHKMRSTCGTKLYNKIGDIYAVAEQLGHNNVENTKKYYARISEERKRKVADILD